MWTISETKVTTVIIVTVRRSMRKPTWRRKSSPAIHVYTAESSRAPFHTCRSAATEAAKEIATERIVTQCENARPSFQPRKPARMDPTSGAKAATQERVIRSMLFLVSPRALALEAPEVVDVDGAQVPEERDQDREPDRGLGGGDREDEEH